MKSFALADARLSVRAAPTTGQCSQISSEPPINQDLSESDKPNKTTTENEKPPHPPEIRSKSASPQRGRAQTGDERRSADIQTLRVRKLGLDWPVNISLSM